MEKLSISQKDELKQIAKKLKRSKPKQLDVVFHKLHAEEFEKIDCLECARCCKELGPIIFQSDIDRMASSQKISSSVFMDKYIKIDEDGDYVFNAHPCPFLMADNYCCIYKNRPKACREYPHTDRRRMHQILEKTQRNADHCPAVFNIIQNIKKMV